MLIFIELDKGIVINYSLSKDFKGAFSVPEGSWVMKMALAFYFAQSPFNIYNFFILANTNVTSIFMLLSVIITMFSVLNSNKEKDALTEEKGEHYSEHNWAKAKGKGVCMEKIWLRRTALCREGCRVPIKKGSLLVMDSAWGENKDTGLSSSVDPSWLGALWKGRRN